MPTPLFSSSSSRWVTLLTVAVIVTALYFGKAIFLPLAVAALISFVLAPLADWLEKYRVPRVASTAGVVAVTFLAVGLVGWGVTDQAVQVSAKLPQYKQNLVQKIRDLRPQSNSVVDRAAKTFEEIGAELRNSPETAQQESHPSPTPTPTQANGQRSAPTETALPVRVVSMPPSTPLAQVWAVLGPILAPLADLAIIVVLVTFILLKREDLRNRLIELAGRSDLRASTEAISEAAQRVSRYLRTALLINSLYGAAIAAGLAIIGLPNPLLWGALGLALRFLPYVGPWIAATMPILLSLVVFDGWLQPLMVVALLVGLEFIVNMVLEPWLYGSGTGISPMGVILAAIFWTWLWGPVGLVVAVPITVCLAVVANYVPQLRFINILIGDQSTLSPPELIYQRLLALDDDEAGELARKQAAQTSLPEFYDEVLLPAVELAQRDRRSGRLDDERLALVMEGLRDLTEEGSAASPPPEEAGELADAPVRSRARVLCVSACGPPCEIAAEMLKQTLVRQGIEAHVGGTELLANELVHRIGEEQFDAVVISVLPPQAVRSGRYLVKKIRQGHPDLPIIVGLWQGQPLSNARQRFDADGATAVATSIREAARTVRQVAVRFPAEGERQELDTSRQRKPPRAIAS